MFPVRRKKNSEGLVKDKEQKSWSMRDKQNRAIATTAQTIEMDGETGYEVCLHALYLR